MLDIVKTFTDDYFFLSNFYEAPLVVNFLGKDYEFSSSEHAYHAKKHLAMTGTVDEQIAFIEKCQAAKTPNASKKVGRSAKIDAKLWDAIKDDCMREVVFRKFIQNSDLASKLLDTGAALLVEGNTWNDTYWGRCNGVGLNRLGAILMEVRGYWVFTIAINAEHASEQDWS